MKSVWLLANIPPFGKTNSLRDSVLHVKGISFAKYEVY